MLPKADVVFDRFPVSRHMGEAVDAMRRGVHKFLAKLCDSHMKGFLYFWVRCAEGIRLE
ncbi:hypothetical protein HNR46_003981 [Haloferula luteola]|uniref:Transposase IS204/IS1001/IS1096/IS1165 DDE domain-containing protein n=1 Tax=Haloferula luteola TaxID=595692 RepID=A0A840VIP0_9BACT|nr:transposase [Haloferula luteola]MBB5353720.1 hypothetical protein [Haloferula luteola]